eukprot:1367522-Pleurochrysis_carterae.AAC.2
MAAVDVLGTLMMLWVIGEVDCTLAVHGERSGRRLRQPQLLKKDPQVNGLLGRLRGGDDFGLAGGESDAGLFF